ncbi:GNAT domain-containing protein [Mycena floridula]|nr:GNAT domain-containing protein [Mycena floridula]
MRANENVKLIGSSVVLVPYTAQHVPKYHAWMQNADLRELTASEPLTLEEEFDMQRKWQMDEDKLTFIILTREGLESRTEMESAMVGDVNIFLNGVIPMSGSDAAPDDSDPDADGFTAELEIMIAEPSHRRKGLALEALQLMLAYATGLSPDFFTQTSDEGPSPTVTQPTVTQSSIEPAPQLSTHLPNPISPKHLITRISTTNIPSIKLFEKLGFVIVKTVEVFGEVEMRWKGKVRERA